MADAPLIDVDPQLIGAAIRLAGVVAAALALATVVGVWRWPAQRRRLVASLVTAARTTWSLLCRVDRPLPLVGGSVGLTLAYGICFWASARAVGIPLDLPTALALELVVAALGGLSATLGGMGVVEAAALQGLLLLGTDPAGALAAVLLHRLLTFWLPALPGALALRSLRPLLAGGAAARPPVTTKLNRHGPWNSPSGRGRLKPAPPTRRTAHRSSPCTPLPPAAPPTPSSYVSGSPRCRAGTTS